MGFEPTTLRFASEDLTAGPTTHNFGLNFKTGTDLYGYFFKLQSIPMVVGSNPTRIRDSNEFYVGFHSNLVEYISL